MQEELGFSAVTPVRTVHAKLEECGALDMLHDEQISVAVQVTTTPNPDPNPNSNPNPDHNPDH